MVILQRIDLMKSKKVDKYSVEFLMEQKEREQKKKNKAEKKRTKEFTKK